MISFYFLHFHSLASRCRRKPFVKIGGFYIGYKKFLACLKPRGDMNDEVMSLYIEVFNVANLKEDIKKFMFTVHMSVSF